MKAMILAAGLGTRLRPLTNDRPKALVELNGRTLLEITIERLRSFGVTDAIVNVHHFADIVIGYLKSHNSFGIRIEISREETLLDTGGGLKKAAWFFLQNSSDLDEPFILHNVDIVSTIDLGAMLQDHQKNRALATLAVQKRDTSRYLLFDDSLQLRGRRFGVNGPVELVAPPSQQHDPARRNEPASSPTPLSFRNDFEALAFSGIHIISPRLLPLITEDGVFSIIPTYLRLAQSRKIRAFRADQYYWRDLGRPEDLAKAASDLKNT